MKVLHVFKTYPPDDFGGIERVIWEIAEGTAAHGVESHVFSLGAEATVEPVRMGAHWSHKAKQDLYVASTGLSLSARSRFRTLVRDFDVIHTHFPWPLADLLHLTSRIGKPSVVTYHSDIVRQKLLLRAYSPLMHAFLGRVDRLVATSPNYLASSEVLARYASKTSVIPIGLRERGPVDPAEVEAWRDRVGSAFCLFVGALRYYKGIDFLLEAARISGVPVVVAGAGDVSAFAARGVPENVRFVGEVTETGKEALLDLCGSFVFPSHLRSEAFGVALLEAARAGRAMISCEIGTGTSYVNADGETGLVVPPADPQALASAMTRLTEDSEATVAMGLAARRRYEALFTTEAMSASYAKLYRSLAGGAVSASPAGL